jgi:hypothetical protein
MTFCPPWLEAGKRLGNAEGFVQDRDDDGDLHIFVESVWIVKFLSGPKRSAQYSMAATSSPGNAAIAFTQRKKV